VKKVCREINNIFGPGTGTNFQHYNEDIELIGIEPSPCMIPRAEKKKEVLLFPGKITLLKIGCGYPEMEKLIEPGTLDAVVLTHQSATTSAFTSRETPSILSWK